MGLYINETVQNQSRKTFVIRLPKFTTVNMARKCPEHASFSIENLFFENYCFGSPKQMSFLTDSELFFIKENTESKKIHGTFNLH